MLNKTMGFIGGGAIAEALINGLVKSGLAKDEQIVVTDISEERLRYLNTTFGVNISTDNLQVASNVDVLFLTIKLQVASKVLEEIRHVVNSSTLVVSVVAGLTINAIEQQLAKVPVIRVMPNTPVAVGAGMAALCSGQLASEEHVSIITKVFKASGRAVVLDESQMDAVTGLSGSGPGYGFVIIDALADAGVRVGLPRKVAVTLAAQTLLGAAKMVLETGEHPAKLRDMVTSPGGTTIAGIHVLEQKGVRAALIDAVIAAAERSEQMGRNN